MPASRTTRTISENVDAAVAIVELGEGLRIAPLHARDKTRVVFSAVYGHQ